MIRRYRYTDGDRSVEVSIEFGPFHFLGAREETFYREEAAKDLSRLLGRKIAPEDIEEVSP
jgi:hypothetical protein